MGLYRFIDAQDRINLRKVSDSKLNEVFQEALSFYPLLMIEETINGKVVRCGWFKKKVVPQYTVYHETPAYDGSPYQACYVIGAGGDAKTVYAYLFGVINGALSQIKNTNTK